MLPLPRWRMSDGDIVAVGGKVSTGIYTAGSISTRKLFWTTVFQLGLKGTQYHTGQQ